MPGKATTFLKMIKSFLGLIIVFHYDFLRQLKYSGAVKGDYANKDTLLSVIMIDYHRLEKGLALKNTKTRFGLWFIPSLIRNLEVFHAKYGNHEILGEAKKALEKYIEFHKKGNINIDEIELLNKKIKYINSSYTHNGINLPQSLHPNSKINFENLVKSRHSVRSFCVDQIDINLIRKAVEIAKFTPSVCNRQPWRTKYITGKLCKQILEIQNGNLGFRDEVNNLLVVTGKISFMRYTTERNQIFIDGGLFSMSLIYSLHSLGIASVGLNWCVEPKVDRKAKKLLSLEDDEIIILVIAIGYQTKDAKITDSLRLDTSNFLKEYKS